METTRTEYIVSCYGRRIRDEAIPSDIILLISRFFEMYSFRWCVPRQELDSGIWRSPIFRVMCYKFQAIIQPQPTLNCIKFSIVVRNNVSNSHSLVESVARMYYELFCRETRSEWKRTATDLKSSHSWNSSAMPIAQCAEHEQFMFTCSIDLFGLLQHPPIRLNATDEYLWRIDRHRFGYGNFYSLSFGADRNWTLFVVPGKHQFGVQLLKLPDRVQMLEVRCIAGGRNQLMRRRRQNACVSYAQNAICWTFDANKIIWNGELCIRVKLEVLGVFGENGKQMDKDSVLLDTK